MAAVQ